MWKNWLSNNFEKQNVEKPMSQISYILAAINALENLTPCKLKHPPWTLKCENFETHLFFSEPLKLTFTQTGTFVQSYIHNTYIPELFCFSGFTSVLRTSALITRDIVDVHHFCPMSIMPSFSQHHHYFYLH